MTNNAPRDLLTFFLERLGRLRFKNLFLVAAGLLLIDLVTPDIIPLIDELLLAVLTMMFWLWRRPDVDVDQGRVIEAEKDPD